MALLIGLVHHYRLSWTGSKWKWKLPAPSVLLEIPLVYESTYFSNRTCHRSLQNLTDQMSSTPLAKYFKQIKPSFNLEFFSLAPSTHLGSHNLYNLKMASSISQRLTGEINGLVMWHELSSCCMFFLSHMMQTIFVPLWHDYWTRLPQKEF